MSDILSPYAVGALLYAPANLSTISHNIIQKAWPSPYSLALCLEDTIPEHAVAQAEDTLFSTFEQLAGSSASFYQPLIFIRVREPAQIPRLFSKLHPFHTLLTGFIAPKFTLQNAPAYLQAISTLPETLFLMPILESADLTHPLHRPHILSQLRTLLDSVRPRILNVRVGGNDFCNVFGLRRHWDETIHEIGCVHQIFSDILACFSPDYVVSGPVWEYFQDPLGHWKSGLQRELKQDLLNGFFGKTVIHPHQIPVVNQALQVSQTDYADALQILQARPDTVSKLVAKSADGGRMNEWKTHTRWAEKICTRAQIYGVLST